MTPFADPQVQAKFAAYPAFARSRLLELRELIFFMAQETSGVGELEETLKWGEPAYLTKNGRGSTIRIDWKSRSPGTCAIYFNCRTSLVDTFKSMFPKDFAFEGNRALVVPLEDELPADSISICLAAALTYHARARG